MRGETRGFDYIRGFLQWRGNCRCCSLCFLSLEAYVFRFLLLVWWIITIMPSFFLFLIHCVFILNFGNCLFFFFFGSFFVPIDAVNAWSILFYLCTSTLIQMSLLWKETMRGITLMLLIIRWVTHIVITRLQI